MQSIKLSPEAIPFENINWVTNSTILLLLGLSIGLFQGLLFQGLLRMDCEDRSLWRQLVHSLLHLNLSHLLINIWSFYKLSYLEQICGPYGYLLLLIALWLLSSCIYWMVNYFLFGSSICSVGFSAVIMGLLGWSRMLETNGKLSPDELGRWMLILVIPILQNPRISLLGHISGLIAGILLHWLWRTISFG